MDNMTQDAVNGWAGHSPATSNMLFNVLIKAHGGDGSISYAERVLFTACEFWADAKNRTLTARLASDGIQELQGAEEAFAAVGLVRVPAILRFERIHLAGNAACVSWRTVANRIEAALEVADEPVDVRLAEFALERTRRD